VSIRGGPPVVLGPVTGGPLGASSGDDNAIVFATDDPGTGLWRVSADGGQPVLLTKPDAVQREGDHGSPSALPGGHSVLFTIAAAGQTNNPQVAVVDVATGHLKTLVSGSQAEYVKGDIASCVARHETAPLRNSKIVGDVHRPGNPFRESDSDGPVAVGWAFRQDRCDLEQECYRDRERREADVTSVDIHNAPMPTVENNSGWVLAVVPSPPSPP